MLQKLNRTQDTSGACVRIKDASYPDAFETGLEFSTPARGGWNIVHTGLLIPEAHEIFVCADACLRGVVLTTAEMHASDRLSTISVRENNVFEGDTEELIIDGVTDILNRLPQVPPAVLIYTSCVHHFIGCDLRHVYKTLRERFPSVDFTDYYMNPIMRKNGLSPDQLMRKQLYSLLKETTLDQDQINIIGNDNPTDPDCELVQMIKNAGMNLLEITSCNTYQEYLKMSASAANISYQPNAVAGGERLVHRLGQKHLYLPLSYDYEEIKASLDSLSEYILSTGHSCNDPFDYKNAIHNCEQALTHAADVLGSMPVAIDYTATPHPLGLAVLLASHGFQVKRVYVDAISKEEKKAFYKLQELVPDLELISTSHVKMRIISHNTDHEYLAIGQKAAYFTNSRHFVNMIEGGGYYGFTGICKLMDLIVDAYLNEKDTRNLIQIKGLGCGCCL